MKKGVVLTVCAVMIIGAGAFQFYDFVKRYSI